MSRVKCSETFSLLSTAGLTALALLMVAPDASAQGTAPPQLNFLLPAGFQIPPADQKCILKGERLDLQCIIANDPDAKRVRAEEATLEANALAAAKSGKLDPYHQVETLGKLEIFDPNLSVNNNLACSYCHDPAAGYANGVPILSVFTGGSNPGSVPITVHGAYPNNRIAKRNPQSYVYATYFPPLHYNPSQADFYGGNFWDGRATGYKLQNSAAVRQTMVELAPDSPVFGITTVQQTVSNSARSTSFFSQLLGTFAALALLLATIGIYGVISYSVGERTREIGLRVALGARPRQVLTLMLKKGFLLSSLGVAIGLLASWVATPALSALLYGVKAHDPVTLVFVSLLLIAVSILAAYVPALRATRVDPIVALRHE